MSRALRFVPFALLLLFLGAVGWRLANPPDSRIVSHLVGRPLPAFALPPALSGRAGVSATAHGPRLVNFFASWCVPCIGEAPLLGRVKAEGVAIDGIAVRDRPDDIARFLARFGDPYRAIGADADSRAQMLLGSSGVPETYVVDGRGIIRLHHVGPVEAGDLPELRSALAAAR